MPELPEVETVRRGLEQQVLGRTVAGVTVTGHRGVRRQPGGEPELRGRLVGRTLVGARRRGKYLWLVLDDGEALVAHLGMSGQFRVGPVASPHDRVTLEFADGGVLRFVDQRTFGWLLADEVGPDGIPAAVAHVARDPFDPDYDPTAVLQRLRRRRSGVKRALLDQTLVSGIGNIYADEALWRARVHFAEPTDRISSRRGAALLAAAAEVMAEALTAGGTSFDALYVDVNGESGWFDRELAAYGRQGRACPRCGTAIRRVQFANRSSFYCPRCQRPRPGRAGRS